jgi:hypothetical protein
LSWRDIHVLELGDGVMLVTLGVALMLGKIRGAAATAPGNIIASLLFIAAGSVLIGGRVLKPASERRLLWTWVGLLGAGVLLYLAANFL